MENIKIRYFYNGIGELKYQTEGSSGIDLIANENRDILSNETCLIKTGLYIIIPYGYEGQVRLRSSIALYGLMLGNGVGTIDSDYRGEVKVMLYNKTMCNYFIEEGKRIAQLIVAPIVKANLIDLKTMENFKTYSPTIRGIGGIGSTGV